MQREILAHCNVDLVSSEGIKFQHEVLKEKIFKPQHGGVFCLFFVVFLFVCLCACLFNLWGFSGSSGELLIVNI